jgi:CHAT domain-containing protein/tetratricopeptide (TPR) repeat protein
VSSQTHLTDEELAEYAHPGTRPQRVRDHLVTCHDCGHRLATFCQAERALFATFAATGFRNQVADVTAAATPANERARDLMAYLREKGVTGAATPLPVGTAPDEGPIRLASVSPARGRWRRAVSIVGGIAGIAAVGLLIVRHSSPRAAVPSSPPTASTTSAGPAAASASAPRGTPAQTAVAPRIDTSDAASRSEPLGVARAAEASGAEPIRAEETRPERRDTRMERGETARGSPAQPLGERRGIASAPVASQGALVLGDSLRRPFVPTTAHRWTLAVAAGEYVELEVLQPEIDLAVRVRHPSGELRQEFDRTGPRGTERARWVSDVTGQWAVDLVPLYPGVAGAYEVRVVARRVPAERDRQLVAADSLSKVASRMSSQERFADAEPLFRQALALWETALGRAHPDVALGLNDLASLLQLQGRYAEAEPLFRQALEIDEQAFGSDHSEVAIALNNLALLFDDEGRFTEAEPLYHRALSIWEQSLGAEHPQSATGLNNLAKLYEREGRFAEAEQLFRRARPIWEKAFGPAHPNVATSLNNLAVLYQHEGDYAEAEPLYRRALRIWEDALGPRDPQVAAGLSNLARVRERQGRYTEAKQLFSRALDIDTVAFGSGHPYVAMDLNNLAGIYVAERRYAEAETLFRRTLAIREKALGPQHPDVARALIGLAGSIWSQRSVDPAARSLLDSAIAILTARPASLEVRSNAFALRARVRKQQRDTAGAFADLAEAIRSAEAQRPQVGGGEHGRAAYFARYREQFERMAQWELEAGDVARAVEYAERGRARVLLDQLAAARVDLRAGTDLALRSRLEAREADSRARVAEYQRRLTLLYVQDFDDSERTRVDARLRDSLRIADRDLAEATQALREASPMWRVLTAGGQSVPLDTIRRRLVPRGGAMLLYQIGAEGSVVFVVPPDDARGPVPAGVEAVPLVVSAPDARTLRLEEGALTADGLTQVLAGTPRSRGLTTVLGRPPAERRAADEQLLLRRLAALRRVLVPERVWQHVQRAQEIVVVPDRGLYTLPFEALVLSPGQTAAETRFWLDAGPPVRYAPSATALYNIEQKARDIASGAPGDTGASVLSLSNPTFELSPLGTGRVPRVTPRVTSSGGTGRGEVPTVVRAAFTARGGPLLPLPGTAEETEAIRRAFVRATGDAVAGVQVLQGGNATERRLRAALAGKRYIHLATHGVVDERRGALFAALALTPPPTMAPPPDDDGLLQLYEIYDLRLPRAELVVLSACKTGAGTAIDGEGVFALSRGFHAAGAPRVIGSEWDVADRATAVLVGAFFHAVAASERAGAAPDYAAALRDAKREVRRAARRADPYFWAPLVLSGAR